MSRRNPEMSMKSIPSYLGHGARWLFLTVLVSFATCMLRCTADLAGGTTTETTNGIVFGKVFLDVDRPAAGIAVRLRSKTFLPGLESATGSHNATKVDKTTDSSGIFYIDSINAGTYILELNSGDSLANGHTLTIATDHHTFDLGKELLQPAGSVEGLVVAEDGRPVDAVIETYGYEHATRTDSLGRFRLRGMPAGLLDLRVVAIDPAMNDLRLDDVEIQASQVSILGTVQLSLDLTSYSQWLYHKRLVINTSATGAALDGNSLLVNFPLLVRLRSPDIDFSHFAFADGRDLRFESSRGTPLDFVIESWPAGVGSGTWPPATEALVWVQVDTVMPGNALQFISMHFGNSGAQDLRDGKGVFDSANGYVGVWHFDNKIMTETVDDASSNGNSLVPVDTQSLQSSVDGVIGSARRMSKNWNSFLEADDTPSLRLQHMTFSAWVRYDSLLVAFPFSMIAIKQDWGQNAGYIFGAFTNDSSQVGLRLLQGSDTLQRIELTAPVESSTAWTHVAATYDGAYMRVFMNGAEAVSRYVGPLTVNNNSINFDVGRALNGDLDELWACNYAQGSDWIRLLYDTQRPNSKVVTITDVR